MPPGREIQRRADFREFEGRGPEGFLPPDSRDQRTQRGARSLGARARSRWFWTKCRGIRPWTSCLRNNGLAKELDGNVLRIATQDTMKQGSRPTSATLAKAAIGCGESGTVTRVLSYAKASELVAPLKRFLSPRGDVMAIDRSNTLIIRDIPGSMPEIDNLIRQLDRKSQQVEIEARVVQASRTFARDIGTQFGVAGVTTTSNSANVFGGSPIATNASPIVHIAGSSALSSARPRGQCRPPLDSVAFEFPGGRADQRFHVLSHLAELRAGLHHHGRGDRKGVGKLLSSPQLVTQNNATAIVKQGTQIPIQTTINNTDLGAIRGRGPEAAGDAADHGRRTRLHGRAGGEHADR